MQDSLLLSEVHHFQIVYYHKSDIAILFLTEFLCSSDSNLTLQ